MYPPRKSAISPKYFGTNEPTMTKNMQRKWSRPRFVKTPPEIEIEEMIEEPPVQVREKMVANNNEIMLLILTYLEGADPDGPSLDTFKVAMINKSFLHMIKTIYQIDDF